MIGKLAPGAASGPGGAESVFASFRPLIRAADGLTLGQVCALTGLEPSTVQNWVKRGFVARPAGKKYRERQLARILLISALRDSLRIEQIGAMLACVNGSADDESDDIITEEELYDLLCRIVRLRDETPAGEADVAALVLSATADYRPPVPGAETRLRSALAVMVCAWFAGEYKREAERRLETLLDGGAAPGKTLQ